MASENFLLRHNVKPGESITLTGPDGPLIIPVLKSYTDYTWKDGTIVVDRAWYAEHFRDQQIDIIDIWLAPGADKEQCLERLRNNLGTRDGLFVLPRAGLLDEVRAQLFRVNNLAYAQQGILGLVALLGVVTSLTISVLERRRELGLLRAVGATRTQVLFSVLAEAMLMGFAGGLLGLIAGWALEWYALEIMLWDEAGFHFPLIFPWSQALVMLGASTALATLVGLWPAWRAACLDIPEAVAAE
jgi:putative ABC transport system permease protein